MQTQKLSSRLKFTAAAALIAASSSAFAMDSTETLPRTVNSPQFRYGIMDGADKKFDATGSLITQIDANSMNFGHREIIALDARASQMLAALNQASPGLGDSINLGTLKIDARPDVRYMAPVFARGITKKLTLAVAIPIINYTNNVELSEDGKSNAKAIHDQVGTSLGAQAETAFATLEAGVVAGLTNALRSGGYKPLVSRQESLVGDLQLHGLYKFYGNKRFSALSRTVVSLPTGKQDDPDDLMDLGTYGELALEQGLVGNLNVTNRITLAVKASYKLVAPLDSDVRVPKSSGDALPGLDRKETVLRDGGDTTTVGGSATVAVNDEFTVGSGIDLSHKQKDQLYGSHSDWDYSILENRSEQTAAKAKICVEYSTTTAYTKGRIKIPFKIAYEFANTFAGKNVLNTSVHEFALSLFF